jgi:hypothetical protein
MSRESVLSLGLGSLSHGTVNSLASATSSSLSTNPASKKPKLHRAIEQNDIEGAMALIKRGALGETDHYGRTCK